MDWLFITANIFGALFTIVMVAELKYGPKTREVVKEEEEDDFDPFVQKFTENPNVRRKVEREEIYDEVDLEDPEHESGKW